MCPVFWLRMKTDDFMKLLGIPEFAIKTGVGLSLLEDFNFSLAGKVNSENSSGVNLANALMETERLNGWFKCMYLLVVGGLETVFLLQLIKLGKYLYK